MSDLPIEYDKAINLITTLNNLSFLKDTTPQLAGLGGLIVDLAAVSKRLADTEADIAARAAARVVEPLSKFCKAPNCTHPEDRTHWSHSESDWRRVNHKQGRICFHHVFNGPPFEAVARDRSS